MKSSARSCSRSDVDGDRLPQKPCNLSAAWRVRADVFTELLAANFYWQETFGATLSWNADLEEVVLIYPLPLADATPESVETIFNRFVELQSAWAERFAEMVADAQDEDDGADDKDGEEGEGAKADLIINP